MQVAELKSALTLVQRNTTAVDAARLIARDQLAGLVIADAVGTPVAVLSAVDVLGLLVPRYVRDDMALAGVLDEQSADEVWPAAGERLIGELLDDDDVQVHDLLELDADATLVEAAARMAEARSQIALVRASGDEEAGLLLLPAVLDAILRLCDVGDDGDVGDDASKPGDGGESRDAGGSRDTGDQAPRA